MFQASRVVRLNRIGCRQPAGNLKAKLGRCNVHDTVALQTKQLLPPTNVNRSTDYRLGRRKVSSCQDVREFLPRRVKRCYERCTRSLHELLPCWAMTVPVKTRAGVFTLFHEYFSDQSVSRSVDDFKNLTSKDEGHDE